VKGSGVKQDPGPRETLNFKRLCSLYLDTFVLKRLMAIRKYSILNPTVLSFSNNKLLIQNFQDFSSSYLADLTI